MKATACVGCGYCCEVCTCQVGLYVYKDPAGVCPGLKWDPIANRHWCQVVLDDKEKKIYIPHMAIGAGCSSSLFNDYRLEIKDRTIKEEPKWKIR